MDLKKRIAIKVAVLLGLVATYAYADIVQQSGGALKLRNPVEDGNLTLTVNDGGSPVDAITVTGSTSVVTLAQPLPVGSGGSGATSLSSGPVYSTGSALTSETVLAMSRGGTNKNMTPVNGGLVYSDADSQEVTSAGTASQWVLSGGAGAPTMSDTTTRAKTIDGSADSVQLTVQGHSSQSSNLVAYQNSSADNIYYFSPSTSNHFSLRAGGPPAVNLQRATTSLSSPAVVSADQSVGVLRGYGHDGTDYEILGTIDFLVDGTPGNNDMPGRIEFNTTPDGTASPTTKMSIASTGIVSLTRANASSYELALRIKDSGNGANEGGYIRFDSGDQTDQVYISHQTEATGSGLAIYTNPASSGSPVKSFSIDKNGKVSIGATGGTQAHAVTGSFAIENLGIFRVGTSGGGGSTCTSACTTEPATYNVSSGACLVAWTSGGVLSACGTTLVSGICMCAGVI